MLVFKNLFLHDVLVGSNYSSIPSSQFFVCYIDGKLIEKSYEVLIEIIYYLFDPDSREHYLSLITIPKTINLN